MDFFGDLNWLSYHCREKHFRLNSKMMNRTLKQHKKRLKIWLYRFRLFDDVCNVKLISTDEVCNRCTEFIFLAFRRVLFLSDFSDELNYENTAAHPIKE